MPRTIRRVGSTNRSPHEAKFALIWRAIGGKTLVPEYKFLEDRRFRFDFADPTTKIAFEIEGGVYSGGRHTRGMGYIKDCEKYNLAALHGWIVYRFPPPLINVPYIDKIKTHHYGKEPFNGKSPQS